MLLVHKMLMVRRVVGCIRKEGVMHAQRHED
jgi:hypothetical protein